MTASSNAEVSVLGYREHKNQGNRTPPKKMVITGQHFFLEAPEEDAFSCLLYFSEVTHIPWLMVLFVFSAISIASL